MLYVGRCESCWKEVAVVAWLEKNVHRVIDSDVSDEQLWQFAQQ